MRTVVANYILWPAAHLVNFRFVPSEQRILFNNCVSVSVQLPSRVWEVPARPALAAEGVGASWLAGWLQIVWTVFLSTVTHTSDADACWIVPTTVPEAIAYTKCWLQWQQIYSGHWTH